MRCLPIFIDSELNQLYYNGYCKSILSPMLHGCTMVYDDAESSFSYQKNTLLTVSYQNAYRRVNTISGMPKIGPLFGSTDISYSSSRGTCGSISPRGIGGRRSRGDRG